MLMGRDAARWRRLLLAALLVVLVPVAADSLADDGWIAGSAQLFDDDGPAPAADAVTLATVALPAPVQPPGPGPLAADDDDVASRPGLPGTDRAPPRLAPSPA
jgi:hypothetical protein